MPDSAPLSSTAREIAGLGPLESSPPTPDYQIPPPDYAARQQPVTLQIHSENLVEPPKIQQFNAVNQAPRSNTPLIVMFILFLVFAAVAIIFYFYPQINLSL